MIRGGQLAARRVVLQATLKRSLSSKAPAESSGGGGGGGALIGLTLLASGGLSGAAYYRETNPKDGSFHGTVDSVPGLASVLDASAGMLRTVGVLGQSDLTPPPPAPKAPFKKVDAEVQRAKDDAKAKREATHQRKLDAEEKAKNDKSKAKEAAAAAMTAVETKVKNNTEKAARLEKDRKEQEEKASAQKANDDAAARKEFEEKTLAAAANAELPATRQVSPSTNETFYAQLPRVGSENGSATRMSSAATDSILSDVTMQAVELRKELEQTLLADLHELDEHALRTRVTQLAAEFFERTKWEGVRTHQSMKQVEADVSKKYDELMRQQRVELELEANKMLLAREQQVIAKAFTEAQDQVASHERHYTAALAKQEAQFKQEMGSALAAQAVDLTDDMQDKLNHEVATLRNGHTQQQLEVQAKISELEAHVAGFNEAIGNLEGLNDSSAQTHRFSAAVLNLQRGLTSQVPVIKEVRAVKKLGGGDVLVDAVVESLPADVLHHGSPDLEELKLRFNVLREELRKVAMAPKDMPPVLGQAVGTVLAKLYWQPTGPVQGPGAEEALSRVAFTLQSNDLKAALAELQTINDPASKSLMADWCKKANSRLVAEQAVKTLQSQSIVMHSRLAESTIN